MKIGVVSDTHYHPCYFNLERLTPYFKDVDMVVHAGDIGNIEILKFLSKFGEVKVVKGNNDFNYKYLNEKEKFSINNFNIGVTHGHIGNMYNIKENAFKSFEGIDLIVFGHTHKPLVEYYRGVLMVNPGSTTRPRAKERISTIAIIEIKNEINAKIIKL